MLILPEGLLIRSKILRFVVLTLTLLIFKGYGGIQVKQQNMNNDLVLPSLVNSKVLWFCGLTYCMPQNITSGFIQQSYGWKYCRIHWSTSS